MSWSNRPTLPKRDLQESLSGDPTFQRRVDLVDLLHAEDRELLARLGPASCRGSLGVTLRFGHRSTGLPGVAGFIITCQNQTGVLAAMALIQHEATHDPVTELRQPARF